jgi:type IV secretory pathway TraG/TraD family ATPase VirD4
MMVYINIKGQKQTRILQEFARSAGRSHEVKLLAPQQIKNSLRCSLLEGCHEIANATDVAAAMMRSAGGATERKSADWCDNQAVEFLTHAIMAVCVDSPKSDQHLLQIRDVVLSGDYKKFAEAHSSFPVLKKFADYVASGNANAATVVATVGEATAFIDLTRQFLSGDDFGLSKFAQQGGLCILEIDPHSVKRLRPLVTMLLGRILGMLQEIASHEVIFPEGNFRVRLLEIGSSPQQVLRILCKLLGKKCGWFSFCQSRFRLTWVAVRLRHPRKSSLR